MNEWKDFYDAIRDTSWPDCDQIDDFVKLPGEIQLEIIQEHFFKKKYTILADKLRNTKKHDCANFLNHIEEIKMLIGTSDTQLNSRDVVFLYSIIWSKSPKNVLEIGRWHGWSSVIIFGALEDRGHGHLYSVDIEDRTNSIIKSIIEHRTTFITASSADILSLKSLDQLQFEVVFIDGDHSYEAVLADLKNTYKILTKEAWILLHDDDWDDVQKAINTFLSQTNDVIDCGRYGETTRLLYKKDYT
jgi:predicted O-methyltransferase YrrM